MAEFHPEARAEILDAVDWYEAAQPGLGADLLSRLTDRVRLLEEMPGLGSVVALRRVHPIVRRFPLGRFPYMLVYLIREDELFILALAHTRRRPMYWRRRVH